MALNKNSSHPLQLAVDHSSLKDFPKLGAIVKPLPPQTALVADDGSTFLVRTTSLCKFSEVLKDALTINETNAPTPTIPIVDTTTEAVAFLAAYVNGAADVHENPPPLDVGSTLSNHHEALFADLLRLKALLELPREFFQAVIRRLELDHGNKMAPIIFVFAVAGGFRPVKASTFLLSDVHQYQYHHPSQYWWARTLAADFPATYDELGGMLKLWEQELLGFVDACTVHDFDFSDKCIADRCPSFVEHKGSKGAFYFNMAMVLWEVVDTFPQCVCLDVLLVALKSAYPKEFCETCATSLAEAVFRHYQFTVTPSSWRLGSLARLEEEMLFDYMNLAGARKYAEEMNR